MSKPLFSLRLLCLICLLGLFFPACTQPAAKDSRQASGPFRETFESGTKRSYAPAEVRLAEGPWLLDRALVGTTAADLRNGAASLRLAPGGVAEMRFDLRELPDTISLRYGAFGSDKDLRLSVWSSADRGASWKLIGRGDGFSGPGLGGITIALSEGFSAPLRFRIQNEGSGRVNVDDFGAGGIPASAYRQVAPDAPARQEAYGRRESDLLLGNPSNAAPTPADPSNYLLVRPQYTLSYNRERGTANWVSWHLSRAEQGTAGRCNCFSADFSLPQGFYRVEGSDYTGSGFDRGHICPSDDRSGSARDNAATFLMPNIAPQAPDLNQKCWRELEEYARRLTTQGKELYIMSGVYGIGGTGSKGSARRIAQGRVTVPAHFWKIILVLPEGSDDLSRINSETEIIAVDMPNTQGAGQYSWQSFRSTVASIENATGYRFFSALPPAVAAALRKH